MATSKFIKPGKSSLNFGKLSAIFFDLDNTLIPTRKGDAKACRKLSEQLQNNHGFSGEEADTVTMNFLQSFRSCPDNPQTSLDSWRSYLWSQALPDRYKHLNESIYRQWLQLRYRYLALTTEYVNLLIKMRAAGYLLALITNGPSNAQWEKIQKLNVSQFFDCILVSSDLPWEKPNPNIFLAACNFLAVKPNECIMVGDKIETDIQGGKAANLCASIWIPSSADKLRNYESDTTISDGDRPDLIIQNVCEIVKYVPRINNNCGNLENDLRDSCSSSSVSGGGTSKTTRRNSSQTGSSRLFNGPPKTSRKFLHYRRGFSLPDIDCNSENSSDSVCS